VRWDELMLERQARLREGYIPGARGHGPVICAPAAIAANLTGCCAGGRCSR